MRIVDTCTFFFVLVSVCMLFLFYIFLLPLFIWTDIV